MQGTERYRRHHTELLSLFREVVGIHATSVAANANALSKSLSKMYGLLVVHLALEDRSLYPRMRNCGDPVLQRLAARYETEMGHLKGQFEAFYKQWATQAAIRNQPELFKRESEQVITTLMQRIERENADFYPRIDAVEAGG